MLERRNAVFTLSLSNPSTQIVRVVGQTADGTAAAGTDYDAKTQSVQFDAGETTAEFLVVLRSDLAFEANETFLVNLVAPLNGTIGDGQRPEPFKTTICDRQSASARRPALKATQEPAAWSLQSVLALPHRRLFP
jgi:hypothetical protein